MKERTYFVIVGMIFAIITILHLLRVIYSWPALIGAVEMPTWASWIAIIVAGYLSYTSFKFRR